MSWRSFKQTLWPQIIALMVLYAIGMATIDGFSSWRSVLAMLVLASFIGIAAPGQTVVALLGGIDLAIPGVIALANIATAELTGQRRPFPVTVLSILAIAALLGGFNGWISRALAINPLIVTLGSQLRHHGRYPGLDGRSADRLRATLAEPVCRPIRHDLWPADCRQSWCCGPLSVAMIVTLRRTPFGKRIYATGASLGAARLALVSTTESGCWPSR